LGELNSKRYSKKIKTECMVCGSIILEIKPSRLERIKTGLTCSKECKAEFFKTYYLGNNNPNSGHKKFGLSPLEVFFNDKTNKLRHTAEQRGISFNIDSKCLIDLYNKQNGLCYYTGIPMSLFTTKNWKFKGQADLDILSVDRIDSSKGYELKNIVLCCTAINKMKGSSEILDFQGFLNFISSKQNNVCHLKVKKLNPQGKSPERAKIGDAGYDLCAATIEDLGDRIKVGTGLSIQPAAGWFCEVYSRSSNTKKGIMLMNSVGIIDNGYTGEIMCIFYKTRENATIQVGDRIAQLIPKRYVMVNIEEVDELDETDRSSNGFGSTGV
jgi:dUTP pyrophosphatase